MIRLTKTQILILHKNLIQQFGGVAGIRDKNLFDSAVETPFHTFDSQDLYLSIIEKAARLCYGLVKNHPFIDGNKRIGVHSMEIFLKLSNFNLNCTDEELIKMILGIADNSITYENFLKQPEYYIEKI